MTDKPQRPDEEEIVLGDEPDDLDADGPAAVREELRRRIKTEGVTAAYDAMVSICRDPKAPAPARATASVTLFRAAGYLSKKAEEEDESEGKPLDQMTDAEMQRELRRLRAHRLRLQAVRDRDEGVFD